MADPSPRPVPGPGTRLNGTYEIERRLGAGGMGIVFQGRGIETGERVAIKMLSDAMARAEPARELFRREALALREVHDPAVVRYFAYAVDPAVGLPYIAMEFVEGPSLAGILRDGPLPVAAVDVLRSRLARGLGAAHRLGIVHRDISPDNVILPGGDPAQSKIIDFGIARSISAGTTIIGQRFAGKTGYMSPEQIGLFGEVTPRSDIYGLGLVLAEAMRGEAVDMGANPVEMIERRKRVPDLGPETPLTPLLRRMLQPDPAQRPASMDEVAAWAIPVEVPRATPGLRRPALAGLGAAAVAAAVTLGVWLPSRREAERPSSEPPAKRVAPPARDEARPAPQAEPVAPAPPAKPAPLPAPTPDPPAAESDTPDLVRAAQAELARVGCYAGPLDGVLGEGTRAAFRAFARDRGVAWSGDVRREGVDFLRAAPAGLCAPVPAAVAAPEARRPAAEPDRRLCRELSDRAELGTLTPADTVRLRTACGSGP